MTLHLSASFPRYSLQLSDRRVTQKDGSRLADFDLDANKNVVFLALDAIVSIGYSGGAFVEGVSTDTWIAERLTGIESFVVGGVLAGWAGALPRVMDIGRSAELLRIELERVTPAMRDGPGFQPIKLAIVGFRWTRRRPHVHQLLWEVWSPDGGRTFRVERREHRYPDAPRIYFALSGDMAVSDPIFPRAGQNISGFERSPDDAETTLLAALRGRADEAPGSIGKDCMSIGISPPENGAWPLARVRYLPERRRPEEVDSQRRRRPAAYSPWLVGPDFVALPGIIVGTHVQRLGPVKVWIDTPALDSASERTTSYRPQSRPQEP